MNLKRVLKINLLLVGLVLPGWLSGQQLAPQDWETPADFRQDEAIVIENIEWLESHPLATASNDTKALSAYVLNWLTGTPYLSVTYDEIFLKRLTHSKKYKFGEKFRITYLFGKSYYLINHQSAANEVKASSRGIEGMLKVYAELLKVDPSVRHAQLEKYARLFRKNRLDAYVETMLEKVAKHDR